MSNYTSSFFGNTYSGIAGVGSNSTHVSNNVLGLAVKGEYVFTASYWDEDAGEVMIIKNGVVIGKVKDLHPGDPYNCGKCIAVDDKYIYIAVSAHNVGREIGGNPGIVPPNGEYWGGIRRVSRGDLNGAKWSNGEGFDYSFLRLNTGTTANVDRKPSSLWLKGTSLYVGDTEGGKVFVIDTTTMTITSTFTIANAQHIVVREDGYFFIATDADTVLLYNTTGTLVSTYTLPSGTVLTSMYLTKDISQSGEYIWYADNGVKQKVFCRDALNFESVQSWGEFGVEGGMIANNGTYTPNAFYGLSAIAVQQEELIINNCSIIENFGAGTDLRHITLSGELRWRLEGHFFVDCADTCNIFGSPDDCKYFYGVNERFVFDPNAELGKETKFDAYTLDFLNYPNDIRTKFRQTSPELRYVQNRILMYTTPQYFGVLGIYKLATPNSKIFKPCGLFTTGDSNNQAMPGSYPPGQPTSGEWMWIDTDNDGDFDPNEYISDTSGNSYYYMGGWGIDSNGGIWKTLRRSVDNIRYFPFQGFDSNDTPLYSFTSSEFFTLPNWIVDPRSIFYCVRTDSLYVTGFTRENPAIAGQWEQTIGSELVRFDGYLLGGNKTKPTFRTTLPIDNRTNTSEYLPANSIAFDLEGNYAFVVTVRTKEVFVYDLSTGLHVFTMVPGQIVGGANLTGWTDTPVAINAKRRFDPIKNKDEYLVFVEEDFRAKILFYRFTP